MTSVLFACDAVNEDATAERVDLALFFNVALPELKSKSLATVIATSLSRTSTLTPLMPVNESPPSGWP